MEKGEEKKEEEEKGDGMSSPGKKTMTSKTKDQRKEPGKGGPLGPPVSWLNQREQTQDNNNPNPNPKPITHTHTQPITT